MHWISSSCGNFAPIPDPTEFAPFLTTAPPSPTGSNLSCREPPLRPTVTPTDPRRPTPADRLPHTCLTPISRCRILPLYC